MTKTNSPYSASMTGCAFLYHEFIRVLPLLKSENVDKLLKEEVQNNHLLMVNSITSRKRFLSEFKKRFYAVPFTFWTFFDQLSESGKRAGLLYVILQTYKLLFDFHFNVVVKHWNSIDQRITREDIMMEFAEISSKDDFVNSWTDLTKSKCTTAYLTIIRQAGLINEQHLQSIQLQPSEYEYYIKNGEEWFLEACLLYPYEIKNIKSKL